MYHNFHSNTLLGGGFKYFYFHPYLGKIPILTNIFQMGWFNHQPAWCSIYYPLLYSLSLVVSVTKFIMLRSLCHGFKGSPDNASVSHAVRWTAKLVGDASVVACIRNSGAAYVCPMKVASGSQNWPKSVGILCEPQRRGEPKKSESVRWSSGKEVRHCSHRSDEYSLAWAVFTDPK